MAPPDSDGFRRAGRAIGSLTLAAFFTVILLSLFRIDHVPWFVAAAFVVLAILTAARPSAGLLVVAVAIPLATFAGARFSYPVAWPEAVAVAFAAGWWLRAAAATHDPPALPPALKILCLLFSTLMAVSVIVDLSVLRLTLDNAALAAALWTHFSLHYFVAGNDFPALQAAALLLEGLVLFAATARLVAAEPALPGRLVRALVSGAALACVFTVQALAARALRTEDFWPAFTGLLTGARFNLHYADVNAAGSHYGMMLFAAAALAWSRGRQWWRWALPAAFIAAGLWMSGSRTALVAGPLALGAMLPLRMLRPGRARTLVAWGGGAALALGVFGAIVFLPARHVNSSLAAQVRAEMSMTALRMTSESPVFGVGPGQFQQRSGEFSSPELLRIFPPAIHENAHNNFLQILAEQGIIGLAIFMGLIILSFVYACGRGSPASRDILVWGCSAGVLAFLLTCLGGHPLLIREPAFSFWMLLGVMAGAGAAAASQGAQDHALAGRRGAVLAGLALLVIAASLPMRAGAHMRDANLEHVGLGVSNWETAPDGVRYRKAANDGSVFVPAASAFKLRVQPLSDSPVRLELRIDGRLADIVDLAPRQWNDITMPVRSSGSGARFVRLDLKVLDRTGDVPIWITKVEPIEP